MASRLRRTRSRVLLIAMPWARLEHPSIQLGLLQAILKARGIAAAQAHLYLDFMAHLAMSDPELDRDAYDDVASRNFMGDWIFAVPPLRAATAEDASYLQFLRDSGENDSFVSKVRAMRAAVPAFLQRASDEIVMQRPEVVGFTTTFGQTIASLVLARMLKDRMPKIKVVLGGAGCDGCMGEALLRSFPWVDVVVRGDAEPVVADLVASLLEGGRPQPKPGLCFRLHGEITVVPMAERATAAETGRDFVEYDDYFDRLALHPFAKQLAAHVSIPFESSRGCWWGEKHHCSFCGLNGTAMTFRAMEPDHVLAELLHLAKKYQRLDFKAVDNIIDKRLFKTMIPKLISLGFDFRIFYEVKANLKKSELAQLAAAGIREIQPGIESLSTPALRRMRKGTSALQNIRLLKWCSAHGIRVHWNLIHGLPGDTSAEYAQAAEAARLCFHLDAPNLVPLQVERFSPYFDRPEDFGLQILGPKAHYSYSYGLEPSALNQIAYAFDHAERAAKEVEPGLSELRTVVDEWQAAERAEESGGLTLMRGPGFALIQDRRGARAPADYRLGEIEAQIYAACDGGIGVAAVRAELGEDSPPLETVVQFLKALVEAGLVFHEAGRYLSLAVEARPLCVDSPETAEQPLRTLDQLSRIGTTIGV